MVLNKTNLSIPRAGKDVEQPRLETLLLETQNGTTTLKNSLTVSYKVKCTLTT